jgi:hypothetical protein
MSGKIEKGRIGSSFDDFLREEGVYEETTERAIKRVLARQIEAAMQENKLTKTAMAKAMKTSRQALDRLLDPTNESVTLSTLARAAKAVGRELRVELV